MFSSAIAALILGEPIVRLDARYEPLPNLLYQLDVVSGYLGSDQSPSLNRLWKERIAIEPSDAKLLERWRDIMRKLETTGQPEFDPGFPFSVSTIQSDAERTREIGLRSASQIEFLRRIAKEVAPDTARALGEIIGHFQSAFLSWWSQEAEPEGRAFQQKASQLLAGEKLQKLSQTLVHFYQPDLPDGYVVPIQFMYKPKASESSHGGQVGSAAFMEFFKGDSPANQIDITMHELSHFLLSKVPVAKRKALAKQFSNSTDPSRMAILSIMDEGLATALNNGMVAEALMKPEPFRQYRDTPLSWYANPAIDGTAKASYDWLKAYAEKGGTLHDSGFATAYVRAVRQGLGPLTDAPILQLFGVNLVWNQAWPDDLKYLPSQYLQSTVSARFSDSRVELAFAEATKSSPLLSTLLILKPSELANVARREPLIKQLEASINKAIKIDGSALAGTRRTSGVALYIIVASGVSGVEKQLKRLASQKADMAGVLP